MQQADGLVLRDIHASVAPAWWPPAPGWWVLAGLLAAALALLAGWRWRRRVHRRRIEALFDTTVDAAETPAAQVAAISDLLRRAARRRDPGADRLHGPDWLRLLDDGCATPVFDGALGVLLLEGGYRAVVDADPVLRLRDAARARFIDWMAPRR